MMQPSATQLSGQTSLLRHKEKGATWHIGPPCALRVHPNVMQRHVSVRVQELVRDTIFPVQRIDKEGRDAPDFSSGELRNTTRRLHLPSPLGYLGGCWGWWWVREHIGVELGFRAESSRRLSLLTTMPTGLLVLSRNHKICNVRVNRLCAINLLTRKHQRRQPETHPQAKRALNVDPSFFTGRIKCRHECMRSTRPREFECLD